MPPNSAVGGCFGGRLEVLALEFVVEVWGPSFRVKGLVLRV